MTKEYHSDKEIKDLELNHRLFALNGFGYILGVADIYTGEVVGYYPIEKTGYFTVKEWELRHASSGGTTS